MAGPRLSPCPGGWRRALCGGTYGNRQRGGSRGDCKALHVPEHNQIKCYQLIEADQKEMENCSQIIAYFLGGGIILETSVPDSGFALILVPHVISIPQE